eukprot:snap_masked-scaffold_6-processed-gene-2.12-mRNA-1 protein AED:1.00 eAED:1.00 QI:0/0/0/0/1/1/2/0/119
MVEVIFGIEVRHQSIVNELQWYEHVQKLNLLRDLPSFALHLGFLCRSEFKFGDDSCEINELESENTWPGLLFSESRIFTTVANVSFHPSSLYLDSMNSSMYTENNENIWLMTWAELSTW